MFDPTPSAPTVLWFLIGWAAGWMLLWHRRCPPPVPAGGTRRPPVAVIIPARDEGAVIGPLCRSLRSQLVLTGDELVVVDDGSVDDTGAAAAAAGATVVQPGEPEHGWAGKPHACRHGVTVTRAPVLLFVDADVRPAPELVERVVAELGRIERSERIDVVSWQPWHVPGGRVGEQMSLLFNVTAVMGAGCCAAVGRRSARGAALAFGPVVCCRRDRYEETGGHGAPTVRGAVAEDLALGRLLGRTSSFAGCRETTYRMYPEGLRQVVEGWTKNVAAGLRTVPVGVAVASVAWMWSLAGGWLASPWLGLASVVQLAILARRVGRFHPLTVVLGPALAIGFALLVLRAVSISLLRRPVRWKGRSLDPR